MKLKSCFFGKVNKVDKPLVKIDQERKDTNYQNE